MNHSPSLSWPLGCAMLLLLLTTTQTNAACDGEGLARELRPASWKADASLTDVTFVDRLHGWAVGSHGVLLRTEDGGQTWKESETARRVAPTPAMSLKEKFQGIQAKQRIGGELTGSDSDFSCRFESVCFTDLKNGWAAGGYDLPSMDFSRAVIARTLDGGKSWQNLPHLMLGRIQNIEMSGLNGWALGPRDPASKSALYFTSDAGNIWNSHKSRRMPDLIDGATAGNRFVGIDREGQPLHFDTAKFEYSAFVGVAHAARLADLSMKDAKNGYAVGDNGTILKTDNGALSWQSVFHKETSLNHFDFRCLDCRGEKVWFAGDPGNVLFCWDPGSGELVARQLPAAGAINAIHFVDEDYGWAVGDFGRIYATSNGGESWDLQRSVSLGGSQCGVMIICEDAAELPLELIAKQGGEDGKRIGVLAVGCENVDAIRLAAERLGAMVVSAIEPGDEAEQLRRIVRTIRLWKPTLLVTAKEAFSDAMQLAGDERAFPAQTNAGLEPWQVDYLMVANEQGNVEYETNVFLPQLGMQLQDLSLPSRMICGRPIRGKRECRFFAWQFSATSKSGLQPIRRSPFSLGSYPRRAETSIPLGSLTSVASLGQKNETINRLLRQQIQSSADWQSCKQQISRLGWQLRAASSGDYLAAVWLTELADRYAAKGQHERAALALEELVRSYPGHCLAPLASVTLARYYASSECRQLAVDDWQQRSARLPAVQRIPNRATSPTGPPPPPRGPLARTNVEQETLDDGRQVFRWNKVDLAAALEEAANQPLTIDVAKELEDFDPETVDLSLDVEAEPPADVETAGVDAEGPAGLTRAGRNAFLRERLRFAANHFSRIGVRDPSLVKRADMLYLQAHIVKQISGSEQAKPYFENVLKADARSAYATAAKLMLGQEPAADSVQAIRSETRPQLDGLPNDIIWQNVMNEQQWVPLLSADDDRSRDIAMIARDDEYLYLYARCYKLDQVRYPEQQQRKLRQRDADLSRRDRIEFRFDVDRDLASSWEVQIDWRGQVRESCDGNANWNPQMFVARHVDQRVWSVECAIRLEDLQSVRAGDRWYWTLRRTREAAVDRMFWPSGEVTAGRLLSFP